MRSAQEIAVIANKLRIHVLNMVHSARAGHIAGPLSSADFIATLYFGEIIRFDPTNPWSEERDRIVLSCGHYVPVLYAALAEANYFSTQELTSFMKAASRLPGHPEYRSAPGIEASAGPLGQGVSVAVGQALAVKIKHGMRPKKDTPRVYCLVSDGELQEGQVWEAFNFAVRRQLDNLLFVVDRNGIQIENYVSQVASYGRLTGRLEAFGLSALEVDGHDIAKIKNSLMLANNIQGGPGVLVLNTVAGKGVSFMESKPEWHDKVPTDNELEIAIKELKKDE